MLVGFSSYLSFYFPSSDLSATSHCIWFIFITTPNQLHLQPTQNIYSFLHLRSLIFFRNQQNIQVTSKWSFLLLFIIFQAIHCISGLARCIKIHILVLFSLHLVKSDLQSFNLGIQSFKSGPAQFFLQLDDDHIWGSLFHIGAFLRLTLSYWGFLDLLFAYLNSSSLDLSLCLTFDTIKNLTHQSLWHIWQSPCHQWQQIHSTISHFVIDGNTHTPPFIIVLSFSCSPYHHARLLSLPLWHQWKRECPLKLSFSLFSCCAWSHANPLGEETTSCLCLRYSKVSLARGLVKMSAICSFVPTYSNLMFFSMTYSLRKWNLIGICFVSECITRFLEMFIAPVFSQSIGMGSSYFTCMYSNVCFIQRTWVQHAAAAMYSALAVDNDTEGCFLLDQDTKQLHK